MCAFVKVTEVTYYISFLDSDYTGTIKILLVNENTYPVTIPARSRICQGIIHRYYTLSSSDLEPASRYFRERKLRKGGLGSTGP